MAKLPAPISMSRRFDKSTIYPAIACVAVIVAFPILGIWNDLHPPKEEPGPSLEAMMAEADQKAPAVVRSILEKGGMTNDVIEAWFRDCETLTQLRRRVEATTMRAQGIPADAIKVIQSQTDHISTAVMECLMPDDREQKD